MALLKTVRNKFKTDDGPSISLWAILGIAIFVIAMIVYFY